MLLFLLGAAFTVLTYQRGLLPLHASAVVQDGAVCAFSGPSGAGKSTLAATLADQRYPFFTDDVLLIQPSTAPDEVLCYAGPKDLKLWEDALAITHARQRSERQRTLRGAQTLCGPQPIQQPLQR